MHGIKVVIFKGYYNHGKCTYISAYIYTHAFSTSTVHSVASKASTPQTIPSYSRKIVLICKKHFGLIML